MCVFGDDDVSLRRISKKLSLMPFSDSSYYLHFAFWCRIGLAYKRSEGGVYVSFGHVCPLQLCNVFRIVSVANGLSGCICLIRDFMVQMCSAFKCVVYSMDRFAPAWDFIGIFSSVICSTVLV